MTLQRLARSEFRKRFDEPPVYGVQAPGRVNLIGEHTDYNEGFVLPMAIDRTMWIALSPRADRRVKLYSLDFEEPADFTLDEVAHGESWDEYVRGMAWALLESGASLRGWNGVLASDIPVGAGLSSSAALEMATAMAFSVASGWAFDPVRMALLGQQAENEWVGAKTGIMDQLISACGIAGHAICIDCRTLTLQPASIPKDMGIIVLDTQTRRGLRDSDYNERRSQCNAAAHHFGVDVLRDVSLESFEEHQGGLDPLLIKRARHVISENARVIQAIEALNAGDKDLLGQLFNASHASLRDDFQVSSHELNTMVEIAQRQKGCFGSRMTGAGFGGCALALVDFPEIETFQRQVGGEYYKATGLRGDIFACEAVDGVCYQQLEGDMAA